MCFSFQPGSAAPGYNLGVARPVGAFSVVFVVSGGRSFGFCSVILGDPGVGPLSGVGGVMGLDRTLKADVSCIRGKTSPVNTPSFL